jgi:glycopeptide antibiotics resistance protein
VLSHQFLKTISSISKVLNLDLRRIFFIFIIIVFLLVIFPFNTSFEPENITILQFRGDYLLHVFIFLPWMFFCNAMRFKIWQWFSLGIFYASFTEGLHYVLPYRVFNINDLLANVMGVVMGFVLFIAFNHFQKTTSN